MNATATHFHLCAQGHQVVAIGAVSGLARFEREAPSIGVEACSNHGKETLRGDRGNFSSHLLVFFLVGSGMATRLVSRGTILFSPFFR